ncbi:MFS transporter, putative metabolite transport protein [Sanguibacter gelidistatuariae]|uniref:MFS transporter, putative metabolite transport protein n=1 Tax=Sanguibacter gelidistatuariae TaxID=1814289 RepID=A0A1G6MZG1_9MICO|nr:MFS transporter [Sanguibacter gelidistatuariae]SDC60953.1 MFS transporter, putative metabolite transport protein [Sanguibacter gelidistatuariae]
MTVDRIRLDDVEMTPFLKKVTLFSAGGPFLDGYVLAIIGVAISQMVRDDELALDARWISVISVAALVGLFLGTSIGGYLTDRIGRKRMFLIDIVGIAVVSVGTAFVSTALMLVVMRFLIGVLVGADYPIATSMVAEFTPRKYRAISMGFIAAIWYVGANAAYVVGYLLMDVDGGWRWMLASAVVPCVVILVGRVGIPESPRWLANKGRVVEADEIVLRIFGASVELEPTAVTQTRYSTLFQPRYLAKVLFVGTIWLCQSVPMFAIYTFGPRIMAAFGLADGRVSILGELVIGTFFMIGCIPAMFWANSMGRRKLLIASFACMTAALAVLGVLPAASTAMVVVCFAVYAFFSGGPGNLQWLYPNELFPTEIRASAVGAAMAFSRIGTVVSIYVLPGFLETHGTRGTMIAGAVISAVGLLVSIAMAPETRGLTLAQASTLGLGARATSTPEASTQKLKEEQR